MKALIKEVHKGSGFKRFLSQWQLQSMALPGIIFLAVFCYVPMFGIIIAFKDADYAINLLDAFSKAKWVGFQFFQEFFTGEDFRNVMSNTIGLNLLMLLINFPAPIIFAILLNEIQSSKFKKAVQTITYFPHFISWIVFGGIIIELLSTETGLVNHMLKALGLIDESLYFMGDPKYFWWIVIISSILKGLGWGSIVYLAAISQINPSLYEAASIDGANRYHMIFHITIPCISGTIIVFFILSLGNLLNSGFDQIWILQNSANILRSEVLDTYVYRVGIREMRYSYTTAVGMFKSVVSIILLSSGHFICKKTAGRGLF